MFGAAAAPLEPDFVWVDADTHADIYTGVGPRSVIIRRPWGRSQVPRWSGYHTGTYIRHVSDAQGDRDRVVISMLRPHPPGCGSLLVDVYDM